MKSIVNYPECFKEALENCGYRYRPLHGKYETFLVHIPSAHNLASVWTIKPHGDVIVTCILDDASPEWKRSLAKDMIHELNRMHRFARVSLEKGLILYGYDFLLCCGAETAVTTAEAYLTLVIETIIPTIFASMTTKLFSKETEVIEA